MQAPFLYLFGPGNKARAWCSRPAFRLLQNQGLVAWTRGVGVLVVCEAGILLSDGRHHPSGIDLFAPLESHSSRMGVVLATLLASTPPTSPLSRTTSGWCQRGNTLKPLVHPIRGHKKRKEQEERTIQLGNTIQATVNHGLTR